MNDHWDGKIINLPDTFIKRGDIDQEKHIVMDMVDYRTLLEFAIKHHEVCEDCEGSGKIYNNADPTSGQWVECPVAELLRRARS